MPSDISTVYRHKHSGVPQYDISTLGKSFPIGKTAMNVYLQMRNVVKRLRVSYRL
jgi:hypothetical protein